MLSREELTELTELFRVDIPPLRTRLTEIFLAMNLGSLSNYDLTRFQFIEYPKGEITVGFEPKPGKQVPHPNVRYTQLLSQDSRDKMVVAFHEAKALNLRRQAGAEPVQSPSRAAYGVGAGGPSPQRPATPPGRSDAKSNEEEVKRDRQLLSTEPEHTLDGYNQYALAAARRQNDSREFINPTYLRLAREYNVGIKRMVDKSGVLKDILKEEKQREAARDRGGPAPQQQQAQAAFFPQPRALTHLQYAELADKAPMGGQNVTAYYLCSAALNDLAAAKIVLSSKHAYLIDKDNLYQIYNIHKDNPEFKQFIKEGSYVIDRGEGQPSEKRTLSEYGNIDRYKREEPRFLEMSKHVRDLPKSMPPPNPR